MTPERSFEPITKRDLRRLGAIALGDLDSLFKRYPHTGRFYKNRLFAIALCQGAALHYVDGSNGVKDFDVWSFFRAHRSRPFPYRRNASADFGDPKFGKSPGRSDYVGRCIDLLGRSLDFPGSQSPEVALREYLSTGSTATARALAQKAVVLIYPPEFLGRVVWPDGERHA
jgi:hypothetical protein